MSFVHRFVRFSIELSDLVAHRYESFQFKLPLHEEEDSTVFFTKVFAYIYGFRPGVQLRPFGREYHDASLIYFPPDDVMEVERDASAFTFIGVPSLKAITRITRDSPKAFLLCYLFSHAEAERFVDQLGTLKHALLPRLKLWIVAKEKMEAFQFLADQKGSIAFFVMNEGEVAISNENETLDIVMEEYGPTINGASASGLS
jgi:uncharacterized protein YaeQ